MRALSRLGAFLSELARRRVFRVAAAYATGGFIALQGAQLILPTLFPTWTYHAAVVLALLGFPVALLLAWVYDIDPDGITRTSMEARRAREDRGRSRPPANGAAAVVEPHPIRAIAVLPFLDMSPEKDQEYLSDGVTEELLNILSRIPGLRVPARTSSFAFKGKDVDIRTIGQKLNVEAVLEGSVRLWEREILITAQLINVGDGYHLWSEKYRRPLGDVFGIQEEIAEAIVNAVRLRFGDGADPPRVIAATSDPGAYTLYLKGRYFFKHGTEEGLRKAVTFFTAAIKRDPGFAAAYAGLGDAYMNLGYYGYVPREKAYPSAKETVRRALELDPMLAEAHASAAWIALRVDWDFAGAEREYRRALALNPTYPTAHQGYALYLSYVGRLDEALLEARRAVELDPLSVAASNTLAVAYMYLQRSERATQQFQTSIELDPGRHILLGNLALAYAYSGAHEEALPLARRALELSGGNVWARFALGYVLAMAGEREEAGNLAAALEEEGREGKISPCFVAAVYVGLGESDRAIEWLEVALERRDDLLLVLAVDPVYLPLRSDPRFEQLLRRIGFPSPTPRLVEA